jgi:hypothetical protein
MIFYQLGVDMDIIYPSGIIATRYEICMLDDGSIGYQYIYKLIGKIFTKGIDELTTSILGYIDSSLKVKQLTLDISEVQGIYFKPARFFSLCDILNKTLSVDNNKITIDVIIGSQLGSQLIGIEDAFDFEIKKKEDQYTVIIKNEKLKKFNINSLLVYGFSIPFISVCLFSMIWAIINLSQSFYGFSIFFSCGVLIYESILLIEIYLKTKDKTKELF